MQVRCPHCENDFEVDVEVELPAETKLRWAITPMPGQMLSASTVGGSLTALHKLLAAAGRTLGARTETLVEGMSIQEDGALVFDLRVLNAPKGLGAAIAALPEQSTETCSRK